MTWRMRANGPNPLPPRSNIPYSVGDAALTAAVDDITLALKDEALPVGEDAGLPLHRFPLANTADAHQAVQGGAVGKVLIDV